MSGVSRRNLLLGGAAVVGSTAIKQPVGAAEASREGAGQPTAVSRRTVRRWTKDTWRSLVAMTDERTGLTADTISDPLTADLRSGHTSPAIIGGYLWSVVVARDLGLIPSHECTSRLTQTLRTLRRLERHRPSGMFFNGYAVTTGAPISAAPISAAPIFAAPISAAPISDSAGDESPSGPFLSSVDNGWLAAALMVVENADPRVAGLARMVLGPMNFAAFYDPEPRAGLSAGLMRGGFWTADAPTDAVRGNYLGRGPDVFYTGHHHDTTVSQARIVSYLAIARRQVPARHYFATWRTPPASSATTRRPRVVGETRRYLDLDVFEGTYTYRGMRIVPARGGSMVEALLPDMFVPEEHWAPHSWGTNHRLTVRAHREHGLDEAGYGYWGFARASDPGGGYRPYGVGAVGHPVNRSDQEGAGDGQAVRGTGAGGAVRHSRKGKRSLPVYGDGVVTPHAAFLALHHERLPAYTNLVRIERELEAYGDGGFFDAVAVRSGTIARRYLALDQAVVMGSIGNVFGGGIVRRAFSRDAVLRRIRPLIAMEEFSAGTS